MMAASQPTEIVVMLPGGLALEDGRVLRRARLRQLSGREEQWLAASVGVRAAPLATQLLGACLLDVEGEPGSPELARLLLVGDRDFLVLQLRRLTFGPLVSAVLRCSVCDAKMDAEFSLDDLVIEERLQRPLFRVPVEQERGPPREVGVRLPTGADQEAVLELPPTAAVEALLDRCLPERPGALAPQQRAALADAIERHAPQVELELSLECPECAHGFSLPFDLTVYFLSEMRATSQQLLREIHSLALYYHWSEAEILSLTRARRRAYLTLLSEAMRRE